MMVVTITRAFGRRAVYTNVDQCTRREGRALGLEVDNIVAAFVRPGLDQAAV